MIRKIIITSNRPSEKRDIFFRRPICFINEKDNRKMESKYKPR